MKPQAIVAAPIAVTLAASAFADARPAILRFERVTVRDQHQSAYFQCDGPNRPATAARKNQGAFDGLGCRNRSRCSPLSLRVSPSASFGRKSCLS